MRGLKECSTGCPIRPSSFVVPVNIVPIVASGGTRRARQRQYAAGGFVLRRWPSAFGLGLFLGFEKVVDAVRVEVV